MPLWVQDQWVHARLRLEGRSRLLAWLANGLVVPMAMVCALKAADGKWRCSGRRATNVWVVGDVVDMSLLSAAQVACVRHWWLPDRRAGMCAPLVAS